MILSDLDLRRAMASGRLVVDKIADDVQIQPASIDLRLGAQIVRFKPSFAPVLADKGMNAEDTETELAEGVVRIKPGEFVLGHTMERVQLAPDLVGRVEGRSSIGRLGLTMHITAGFIDPGFNGQITLEIANLSRRTVLVPVGHRVCQIVVHQLSASAERPYGSGAVASKFGGVQRGAVPFLAPCEADFELFDD